MLYFSFLVPHLHIYAVYLIYKVIQCFSLRKLEVWYIIKFDQTSGNLAANISKLKRVHQWNGFSLPSFKDFLISILFNLFLKCSFFYSFSSLPKTGSSDCLIKWQNRQWDKEAGKISFHKNKNAEMKTFPTWKYIYDNIFNLKIPTMEETCQNRWVYSCKNGSLVECYAQLLIPKLIEDKKRNLQVLWDVCGGIKLVWKHCNVCCSVPLPPLLSTPL